jgi:hypothetical protein
MIEQAKHANRLFLSTGQKSASPPPVVEKEIPLQLHTLAAHLDHLDKVVNTLEDRLLPVSSPPTPENSAAGCLGSSVPFAAYLETQGYRLQSLTIRLVAATNRLEF